MNRARLISAAGTFIGGAALGFAVWGGNPWSAAFSGVMFGSTLTLCIWVWVKAR